MRVVDVSWLLAVVVEVLFCVVCCCLLLRVVGCCCVLIVVVVRCRVLSCGVDCFAWSRVALLFVVAWH